MQIIIFGILYKSGGVSLKRSDFQYQCIMHNIDYVCYQKGTAFAIILHMRKQHATIQQLPNALHCGSLQWHVGVIVAPHAVRGLKSDKG